MNTWRMETAVRPGAQGDCCPQNRPRALARGPETDPRPNGAPPQALKPVEPPHTKEPLSNGEPLDRGSFEGSSA